MHWFADLNLNTAILGERARFLMIAGDENQVGPNSRGEVRQPRASWKKTAFAVTGVVLLVVGTYTWCTLPSSGGTVALRGLAQESAKGFELPLATTLPPANASLPAANAPAPEAISLFCWSHMEVDSYEERLIRMQLVRRASIFACEEYAVISSKKVKIGDIWGAPVFTWVNDLPKVTMGQIGVGGQTTDSFLNTKVFLVAWDSLMDSKQIWHHDFVVKVDPDAVFLPDRLKSHVKSHAGEPVYFSNCGKWGPNTLLYGSLEVFSTPALRKYQKQVKTCKALPWEGWGEDYYMQHCMNAIGVTEVPDTAQVADDRCLPAPCSDWTKVAFHDFKEPKDWYNCFKMAIGENETDDSLIPYLADPTTTTTTTKGPSLFCWSRMELNSYEEKLIRMQLIRRASIFACDEFAVITSNKTKIGDIGGAPVYTWVNDLPKVEMGKNGVAGQTTDSFLNTEIFLIAWDSLLSGAQIWNHDFVAKVDPDAVFFPDRLKKHVAPHRGEPVYFSNCGKWGPKVLLYGSLEVFSTPALKKYEQNLATCKALPWKGWGEDYYMQHCMNAINVIEVPDTTQVADDRCLPAPCSDWTKVAFHDFKDPGDWYDCFKEAIGEKQDDSSLEVIIRK